MATKLLIGIDGGGTICRARIRDLDGNLLGEGVGGPANVFRDFSQTLQSISAATYAAAASAGLADTELGRMHAGLGLAGAGMEGIRERLYPDGRPFASVTVGTDLYIAWLGAHEGQDGAIINLGTGSAGLGHADGRWHFLGGWGPNVSDDAGGVAIGRAALRTALLVHDKLMPPSPLAETILSRFEGTPQKIAAFAEKATPAVYSALAPLVFEHASREDPIALAIVSDAAGHVARMIGRFRDLGAPAISLTGGLSAFLAPYLPPWAQDLIVAPKKDALDGAIQMARKRLLGAQSLE